MVPDTISIWLVELVNGYRKEKAPHSERSSSMRGLLLLLDLFPGQVAVGGECELPAHAIRLKLVVGIEWDD